MFGFITANTAILSQDQKDRYRSFYCGLCLALKDRYGNLPRLTLSYDMTFVILVLSSMYEPETATGPFRCAVHPVEKHIYSRNEVTDYVADMSVVLAYYDVRDDWLDDRKLSAKIGSDLLKKSYLQVRERYPEKCRVIEESMALLTEKEKDPASGPDEAAAAFGLLMGEVFAYRPGFFTDRLRAFGDSLGRFVFMMDAAVDLEDDLRRGSPNPFLHMEGGEKLSLEDRQSFLKLMAGRYSYDFEQLPLVQDVDILRNVLYSGVWFQLEQKKQKLQQAEKKDEKKVSGNGE